MTHYSCNSFASVGDQGCKSIPGPFYPYAVDLIQGNCIVYPHNLFVQIERVSLKQASNKM